MTIDAKDGKAIKEAVQATVARYSASQDELIPILNDLNREIGFLPKEALDEISSLLRVPKSQLFSVASFYRMLSTKQRGKHVIQFCESAPCHVVGGREVWHSLQNELHLFDGETSADGLWTLVTTSCLGICGVGPVMVIDSDIYGNVEPSQVSSILAKYH